MAARVCVVDIGSTHVCAAVCDLADNQFQIEGVGVAPFDYDANQIIRNRDLLKTAIEKSLLRTGGSLIEGTPTIMAVSGLDLVFTRRPCVSQPHQVPAAITSQHLESAMDQSQRLAMPPRTTCLHRVQVKCLIDGQPLQTLPAKGRHIEMDLFFIAQDAAVQSAMRGIARDLKLPVNRVVYDVWGIKNVVCTATERQRGVWLLDIGGKWSTWSFIRSDQLIASAVFNIGSATISDDIAAVFEINDADAERLKTVYGTLGGRKTDDVLPTQGPGLARKTVSRKQLNQVIQARVDELIREIRSKSVAKMLAQYPIVVTGGGALLKDLKPYLIDHLGAVVRIAEPTEPFSFITDSRWTAAVGVAVSHHQQLEAPTQKRMLFSKLASKPVFKAVQNWFR